MDTPLVNGTVYPFMQVGPKAYRFQILNASNDRFLNLQLYYAKSNAAMWSGTTLMDANAGEVNMVPAAPGTGLPATWPTDGRDGGVPDPTAAGPSWIQIGTEGGFLPQATVIPPTPVGFDYNRRSIVVLNILNKSLYLGPAERADVIVDFSGIPDGTKLILYNDSPAPVPAFDPRNDYYTGNPDNTSSGGAPSTLPGYGPNTRTIMQFQVTLAKGSAPAYNLATLQSTLPTAYAKYQDPPIVPQAAYNAAFGKTYKDVFSRIQDTQLTFSNRAGTGNLTLGMEPKAIQELFTTDYGRMNAILGVEVPNTSATIQTTIPYMYIDPPDELIKNTKLTTSPIGAPGDGTEIWKITHNGVDTHALHWHMFNVQLINRVGWDGQIRPPDANEVGWKETIRMNPLEDIIVALRPIEPNLPVAWGGLPNSIRPLDVTQPLGTVTQFTGVDPTNAPAAVINRLVNYGWEYVWHCHLLGHEENDMMRPIIYQVPPPDPSTLVATVPTQGQPRVRLTWKDNSRNETRWTVQRATVATGPWTNILVPSTTGPAIGGTITYTDNKVKQATTYFYRVIANNVVGYTQVYAAPAVGYPNTSVDSAPTATVPAVIP